VLNLPESLIDSTIYVLKVSISATLSSALIGYGFDRFVFPLKKLFFAILEEQKNITNLISAIYQDC
jgi:multiple sugar transport system permease protein